MLAALQDKDVPREKPLFWNWSRGKAVRKGKWKLVCWGSKGKKSKDPAWELYDMEKDRTELNDLSSTHPEIVKELSGLHAKWLEGCKTSS